ncbi:MAG: aldehyde dehydrogenase family protein [Bacteroidia bacterium]|nr:aldehyde dehydrogenase family protein [Bacteroidia bacterium]MDW8235234.1 aldehyde dehydrogenase family protein [Bacteroidia bacterium]
MLRPLIIAGEPKLSRDIRPLYAPYSGEVLAEVAYAEPSHIQEVLEKVAEGQKAAAALPTYKRYAILNALVGWIEREGEKLARGIAQEAAKPLRYARLEVQRGWQTLSAGRDLVRQSEGEILSGDISPATEGRWVLVRRVPTGALLAITPFNFPLNLVLHKVVPAIVAGCAITLKPAPQAPLTAYALAEALLEAGWPPIALSVVMADPPLAEQLVRSNAYRLFSFTGSAGVGWHLQSIALRKKVLLELGGSAAVIVHDGLDLERAAAAIAEAAYLYAGQVCISVQRIFVQRRLYAEFIDIYRKATVSLKVGDPLSEEVHLSSLIDERSYNRVQQWLMEARMGGAQELIPPQVDSQRRIISPVLMAEVPTASALAQEEAFAPYAEIRSYDTLEEAIAGVNASPYGLQAGIYTTSEAVLKQAYRELEVGGVIHNAPPTLRLDAMPYGGVKGSGLGREGVKYAYWEYTEPKTLLW